MFQPKRNDMEKSDVDTYDYFMLMYLARSEGSL